MKPASHTMPVKIGTVTITIKDDKEIVTDKRSFKATLTALKENAMRLPMMNGPAFYDLMKNGSVRINAPDGSVTYDLEVSNAN